MGAQHSLILSLPHQQEPRLRHPGQKLRQDIDREFLVFLEMQASYTSKNTGILPAEFRPDLFSQSDPGLDLFHVDSIADHDRGMPQLTLAAAPGVKPFRRIVGACPEVCGILSQLRAVCLMEHTAELRVHVLSVMTVDDPLRDPVFYGQFQIVYIGQAVHIHPDRLIFPGMLHEKAFQLPFKPQGVPAS